MDATLILWGQGAATPALIRLIEIIYRCRRLLKNNICVVAVSLYWVVLGTQTDILPNNKGVYNHDSLGRRNFEKTSTIKGIKYKQNYIHFFSLFFVMNLFLYKTVTVVLAVALLSTSILAATCFFMLPNRPELSDDARLAYEQQICNLQEKLNHSSCVVSGEIIYFDTLGKFGHDFT